jgi:hypothetical protein
MNNSKTNLLLFDKHSRITSSPMYLCYLILNENVRSPGQLHADRKIPIYSIFNQIRKINPKVPNRQIYFSIFLMYALDLIEFERPYMIIRKHDKDK